MSQQITEVQAMDPLALDSASDQSNRHLIYTLIDVDKRLSLN